MADMMALMQFCTASMSAIMKLTKHGAIIPTHTPCLVIANMADMMEAVRNCISTRTTWCNETKIWISAVPGVFGYLRV